MAINQSLESVLNTSDVYGNGVKAAFHLQNSNHPGLILVSNLPTGANYHSWSRAMNIALGAKMKTGFINGKFPRPAEDDAIFERTVTQLS
ncbi:hypothetical protein Sjap_018821 [Stephania japonica]|uniref:Retrotransposon Copia-like N-terminal domain-containing protein n=1 Tax=Stephania japonica TaxID=461633 RepID=A0AAP0I9G8_9MAGN